MKSTTSGVPAINGYSERFPRGAVFFKTHHPYNRVVGGGLFSGFASLRISEAWELFGAGNGVDSLAGMRNLVRRLPPQENRARRGPVDGCVSASAFATRPSSTSMTTSERRQG